MMLNVIAAIAAQGRRVAPVVGGGGGFTPPYTLPGAGASLALTAPGGNLAQDVRPAAFSTTQFNYSLYNSYGSGVFNEDYSAGGAFCIGPSGGHQHPDFTGVIAFDFTDGIWKIHEHNNGGTRYGGNLGDLGYSEAQSSGTPYYEVTGSGETPCPPHPYQNNVWLPAAAGGSAKGDIVMCGHGALFIGGIVHSGSLHRFNLATNLWSRASTAQLAHISYETAAVYDSVRGRFWIMPQGADGDQFIQYVRISDWTVQQMSIGGFPPGVTGNGGRGWMYADLVFLQCNDNTLLCFDPNAPLSGWSTITLSGGVMPSYKNRFIFYPRTGKFYHNTQLGGATLTRLTPPATNPRTNTWTIDTTTVSPALPRQTQEGDGGDLADHVGALVYVPSINRLGWFPGGSVLVQLLDPT